MIEVKAEHLQPVDGEAPRNGHDALAAAGCEGIR